MATIEITHVGDNADLSALKRNFANLLQEKFGAKQPTTMADRIKAKNIDEKHAVSLLRRRARYQQHLDRPKYFASCTYIPTSYMYNKTQPVIDQDVSSLRNPSDTATYVSAWCRLNHLTA